MNSALLNAGYRVSSSHANSNAFKTNAPPNVVWDIMRSWVKLHPIHAEKHNESSPARRILSKEPKIEVSFEMHPEANPPSRQVRMMRFEEHRGQNWGPKKRASKR